MLPWYKGERKEKKTAFPMVFVPTDDAYSGSSALYASPLPSISCWGTQEGCKPIAAWHKSKEEKAGFVIRIPNGYERERGSIVISCACYDAIMALSPPLPISLLVLYTVRTSMPIRKLAMCTLSTYVYVCTKGSLAGSTGILAQNTKRHGVELSRLACLPLL